jgi:hypothetical protein
MAQHVAGGIAGKDGVVFYFGEEFARVVVKNDTEEIAERAAVRNLWAKKCGGVFTPRELGGRGVTGEPAMFAENFGNIARCKKVCGGGRSLIRSFMGSHPENLSAICPYGL